MGTERDMNMTIIALGVFLPWESSHAVGPRTAFFPTAQSRHCSTRRSAAKVIPEPRFRNSLLSSTYGIMVSRHSTESALCSAQLNRLGGSGRAAWGLGPWGPRAASRRGALSAGLILPGLSDPKA